VFRLILFFVLVSPFTLCAQSTSEFPSDDEIKTLMAQADMAMKEYQEAMSEETTKLGKDKDSIDKDKSASQGWIMLLSVVKANSENFNSGGGFLVVDQLDHAYGDALSCAINGLTVMSTAFVVKDESHQDAGKEVANSCGHAAQCTATLRTEHLGPRKVV
jgi:hypothetical protein